MAKEQFEILVYTQPDKWHTESIQPIKRAFEKMAARHHFRLTWTEQASFFMPDTLARFAAVVFSNANGGSLDERQRTAFEKYIQNGGGFVGLHATSVTDGKWPWFEQLVGRVFAGHPKIQTGILQVINNRFPATSHLPARWTWTDEWYIFSEPKSGLLRTVLQVDEATYDVTRGYGDPISGMGEFHPIAWYQEIDGGRAFYSALGHKPETYLDAKHLDFIYGAIYWAATGKGLLPRKVR